MGLVDILNKVPLKAASKLVEKTGVSKYSYAQVCNFTGALPAAWCAFEGYQTGSLLAGIVGGALTGFNMLFMIYNPRRKAIENPNYIENTVNEIYDERPGVDKGAVKEALEEQLVKLNASEQGLKPSALFQTLTGVGLGALGGMLYFGTAGEIDEGVRSSIVFTTTAGLSSLLMGFSHYFRASK